MDPINKTSMAWSWIQTNVWQISNTGTSLSPPFHYLPSPWINICGHWGSSPGYKAGLFPRGALPHGSSRLSPVDPPLHDSLPGAREGEDFVLPQSYCKIINHKLYENPTPNGPNDNILYLMSASVIHRKWCTGTCNDRFIEMSVIPKCESQAFSWIDIFWCWNN